MLLLLSLPLFAQVTVSGKIVAVSGEALPGASVILKNSEGKFSGYGISQENGAYLIAVKEGGDYTLEANFLGYEKEIRKISIDDKNIIQNFSLKESQEQLKELVIEADQPVKLRGDTLVYDAKALSTGHEVVVEDLLKRIPGVTVQKDGKIFYGENEVQKVMVEGDDLFNRGYSLLTKNMPSKPLDKVEVLQNYSNNKLLKGIEDSDGVALNLTLYDKYKNIWFGDATLGYGTDERYDAGGSIMNFSKAYKNFLTFNLNNAGRDRVGDINSMIYYSNDLETTGQDSRGAASVMGLSVPNPRLDESRSRFNNSEMGTLSTVIPVSPKLKLQMKGFVGFDELKGRNTSYSVVDVPGTFFENSESNSARNKIRKGYINTYLNYDISASAMLQMSSSFNKGSTNFRNDLVFNGDATREELKIQNTYADQKVTYTHKWNERNAVMVKGRFFSDRLPQQYGINDYLLGDLFVNEGVAAIGNNVRSSKQYAGVQADFKLKQKNNDLIEFNVGYNDTRENLATRFSLFTADATIQPDGFQSDSEYNVGELYANGGYKWKFKKLSVGLNASLHQLFNGFSNIEGNESKQNPFYINPNIHASYSFNPQNTITANYNYRVNNSSLLQVNDAYLLTSSRSFSRGLGYFNQLENTSVSANYSTKHYLNRYSFSWGVTYAGQNDVISYRSRIEQNSSLSEAFVMKGGDRYGANFTSHMVIRKLNGSVQFNIRADRSVYYNMVNDLGLRKVTHYGQSYRLGWKSDFKGSFDFNLGTDWDFSQTKSNSTFKNSTKISFLDLMYKTGESFTAKLTTEHYNFGGVDRYSDYLFSDFESSYSFQKQKYIVTLTAMNLFNTATFTTYNISDVGYSTNSYRLLPRYVMLSFKFRF